MIKFTHYGKPISKDNEKIRNKQGRIFKSKRFRQFEQSVRYDAQIAMQGNPPIEGDVRATLVFYFPDKRRTDLFNAPKSVCDALNGVVYIDDKQITEGHLYVRYDKDNPRTEIQIERIESENE